MSNINVIDFKIKECPVAYTEVKPEDIIPHPENIFVYEYKSHILGSVILTDQSYLALQNTGNRTINSIIAGVCRHHFEKYKKSYKITYDFVKFGYKGYPYPKSFREKAFFYLRYLYENGGNEYNVFSVHEYKDYPLAFALDHEEFVRILNMFQTEGLMNVQIIRHQVYYYYSLSFTKFGILEMQKVLPPLPMVGLVDQEIRTGNVETDEKINHAKKLFFNNNATLEDKRSACITLSAVLEPIREELKQYFSNPDVSDFFRMVNEFDIRHNKATTKDIKSPEQLEWVFYSLLNTISCYIKLTQSNL